MNAFNDLPVGLQLFQDAVSRILSDENQVRPWSPAVDILETENDLIFKVDAAVGLVLAPMAVGPRSSRPHPSGKAVKLLVFRTTQS